MRTTKACLACRQQKIKCVFVNEITPCKYCKNKGVETTCILYTTREYIKLKGPSKKQEIEKIKRKIQCNSNLKSDIKLSMQHYPELFFLNLILDNNENTEIDSILVFSIKTLISPFNNSLTDEKRDELINNLEFQILLKVNDKNSNQVLIMQCIIILLIIQWQKGRNFKGYLIGGLAERAYKALANINIENLSIFDQEIFLTTIWSYQVLALSLRDEPTQMVKSRLYRFRLPSYNVQNATDHHFIGNLENFKSNNLISLFIMSSEIWIDCLSMTIKGGKYYYKEAPWDHNSDWNKLSKKIYSFNNNLESEDKFSLENLRSKFLSDGCTTYCSIHLTLMISEILIHRDFIPFIPSDTEGAKGPFDKLPWLSDAPKGWWKQSASIVFNTAKNISIILNACKQHNKYSCNTFNGFIALTAASVLSYVKHFPYFDRDFKNAETYYEYCLEYLLYYKKYFSIGGYYYKILVHNEKIFDLAIQKGVSTLITTIFEQLKNEILDIANVDCSSSANYRHQMEKYFNNEKQTFADENETCQNFEGSYQDISTLMTWDIDWWGPEQMQTPWNSFIEGTPQ